MNPETTQLDWAEPLCLLTEANDGQAFVELPDCEHCHGTGKNLTGWDPHQDSP